LKAALDILCACIVPEFTSFNDVVRSGVYDVFKVFFIKKYIKKIYFNFFKLCFYIIIPKQFKNIKKFILNKFIFSKFT